MIFSKKSKAARINSLIGAGTRLVGDIEFTGGLHVDGDIQGNIRSADDAAAILVVSEHGNIEGSIDVAHVVINGSVTGPLCAHKFLELQTKARINGDIEYHQIEIREGAEVNGRLILKSAPENTVTEIPQEFIKLAAANG